MTCASQWKIFGMFRFLYKDEPTRKNIIQQQPKKTKEIKQQTVIKRNHL